MKEYDRDHPARARPRLTRVPALLATLCAVVATTAVSAAPAATAGAGQRRPVYAIAHRVDTLGGVDAALKHGANSIEIDVCTWWNPNEWRAWHDCSSAGDNRLGPSFDSMVDRILSHASAGRRLSMVWLDIKDPNYCGERENRGCSVAGLRDKAQRLTAAGIQVLYGFYEYHGGGTPDVGGRGWQSLEGRLGPLEGITTTGTRDRVQGAFDRSGSGFPAGRRVMDYGDSWQCANSITLIRDWVNRHGATHRMAAPGDRMFR
ncbi:phospholipase [Streptomyces sp. NPDC085612]|uniref:phospholipase n=1 Tax=Streptomyces sp. NPDC085612 TaxID=3365732 RepID=UPI0037D11D54